MSRPWITARQPLAELLETKQLLVHPGYYFDLPLPSALVMSLPCHPKISSAGPA